MNQISSQSKAFNATSRMINPFHEDTENLIRTHLIKRFPQITKTTQITLRMV